MVTMVCPCFVQESLQKMNEVGVGSDDGGQTKEPGEKTRGGHRGGRTHKGARQDDDDDIEHTLGPLV